MSNRSAIKSNVFIIFLMACLFIPAMSRIKDRVEITMLGYQLGVLKQEEKILLQKTSELENNLTALTSIYKLKKYARSMHPNESKSKKAAP